MRVYHRTPMPAQVRLQEGESYGRAKQMALTSSQPSSSRGTSERDTSGRYTDQSADSQSGLCSSYIAARNADASSLAQHDDALAQEFGDGEWMPAHHAKYPTLEERLSGGLTRNPAFRAEAAATAAAAAVAARGGGGG